MPSTTSILVSILFMRSRSRMNHAARVLALLVDDGRDGGSFPARLHERGHEERHVDVLGPLRHSAQGFLPGHVDQVDLAVDAPELLADRPHFLRPGHFPERLVDRHARRHGGRKALQGVRYCFLDGLAAPLPLAREERARGREPRRRPQGAARRSGDWPVHAARREPRGSGGRRNGDASAAPCLGAHPHARPVELVAQRALPFARDRQGSFDYGGDAAYPARPGRLLALIAFGARPLEHPFAFDGLGERRQRALVREGGGHGGETGDDCCYCDFLHVLIPPNPL